MGPPCVLSGACRKSAWLQEFFFDGSTSTALGSKKYFILSSIPHSLRMIHHRFISMCTTFLSLSKLTSPCISNLPSSSLCPVSGSLSSSLSHLLPELHQHRLLLRLASLRLLTARTRRQRGKKASKGRKGNEDREEKSKAGGATGKCR
jgi:hypothetical protein